MNQNPEYRFNVVNSILYLEPETSILTKSFGTALPGTISPFRFDFVARNFN